MSKLRERFIDEMKLKGLAESTSEVYFHGVKRFVDYCGKPPLGITDEEIRGYLLHLKQRKIAARTYNVTVGAIRTFYGCVAPDRVLPLFKRAPIPFVLPEVFSVEEVGKLLSVVRNKKYKTILSLLYATGLRIGECMKLKVGNIDGKRKLVEVKQGKGSKDRTIPLPESVRSLLRDDYKTYRPADWLFEGIPKARHLLSSAVRIVMCIAIK